MTVINMLGVSYWLSDKQQIWVIHFGSKCDTPLRLTILPNITGKKHDLLRELQEAAMR